ncbi:unnamed protein product [Tilletia caries]|nr:unnamed protein product [Tilletia caries]
MSKRKGDSAGRERAAKRTQIGYGWPTSVEPGVIERIFVDDAISTDELLTDVAAELRDRPYDFQLTDIRGSGYYGPYHSLIVAEAIKKRLRQRVTECSELSLARAAEQMLPLLFARLIEKDGNIARRAAADVLRDSRVYGLLVFPASLLRE